METTIGADIEVFFYRDGKPFNLAGKIPGTKHNPVKTDFGVESWDNVSYEYAIDYTTDRHAFKDRVVAGLQRANELAASMDCMVKIDASAVFAPELLDTPEAMVFGCEPDFSAWTMQENVNPLLRLKNLDPGLRSCGGHIHVGNTKVDHIQLIRLMDKYLGLPSVLLDTDSRRRSLYGRAGAHRKKPYGVEYRSLSNFWTTNLGLIYWVWDQVETCVAKACKENLWVKEADAREIVKCINESDKEKAFRMCNTLGIYVPDQRFL